MGTAKKIPIQRHTIHSHKHTPMSPSKNPKHMENAVPTYTVRTLRRLPVRSLNVKGMRRVNTEMAQYPQPCRGK